MLEEKCNGGSAVVSAFFLRRLKLDYQSLTSHLPSPISRLPSPGSLAPWLLLGSSLSN
jgi:hypothetical protein